ncbi:MAG: PorV/PorQ family protein [Bacteroidota bacterium]|nr:PorV/PorQ family protein [Bacteroidota bacterium]
MLKQAAFFVVLYLFITNTYAQTRKYSNEFLNIGVSARAFGMGNSVIASCNDVSAAYWNPAGLMRAKEKFQFSVMHSNYFSGIANYDYGGVYKRFDDQNAGGFSIIRFGIDNIPNTIDLRGPSGEIDYNRIKTFSAADWAFMGTYSHMLRNGNTSIGGTAKLIHRTIGSFANAWGFGFDFGMQHKKDDWIFAVMARDVTFTFTGWKYTFTETEKAQLQQTGNVVPQSSLEVATPRIIGGVSRKITLNEKISMLPEANLQITTDGRRNSLISTRAGSVNPSLGVETNYADIVFLRVGIYNFQKEKDILGKTKTTLQPTIGVGLKLNNLMVDYAFTDIGGSSAALYSHVFSLRLGIGKVETEE